MSFMRFGDKNQDVPTRELLAKAPRRREFTKDKPLPREPPTLRGRSCYTLL